MPDVYLSPDLNFAKICRVPLPDAADKDWTAWKGEPVDVSNEDLLRTAKRFAGGTALVKRDRALARRLFEYLTHRDGPHLHVGQVRAWPAAP